MKPTPFLVTTEGINTLRAQQFSGAIIKTTQLKATHLVFSSGKIVISGTRNV